MPYVIATALTVSVDALIVGYSVSLATQRNFALPLTVAVITYFMCLAASIAGTLLQGFLKNYVRYIGGVILVGLGLSALRKKSETTQNSNFAQCLLTGFGVGVDGAIANLTLVESVADIIFVPALFAITHFVAIYVGQSLAQNTKIEKANIFSAIMFFVLAAVKFADL